ncbi:MAG: hypothetical protein HUJ73_06490, partial [Eubacterium sp.]|nr:hypothetical protein [Eubacterium sp.]
EKKKAKKKKRRLITAAVLAGGILLFSGFFLYYQFHREAFLFHNTPTETFYLIPEDGVDLALYTTAEKVLEERIRVLLNSNQYVIEKLDDNVIRCVVPQSTFHGLNAANNIRVFLTRPGNVYFSQSDQEILGLRPEDIVEVRQLNGSKSDDSSKNGISGAGSTDKSAASELSFAIRLTPEYYEKLAGLQKNDPAGIYLTIDGPEYAWYPSLFVRFPEDDASDEKDTIYVSFSSSETASGRYGDAFRNLLLSEPLSDSVFGVYAEIPTVWEDIGQSLIPGENQVEETALTGNRVRMSFTPSGSYENDAEERGNLLHTVSNLKLWLDAMQIPYAFGTEAGYKTHYVVEIEEKYYSPSFPALIETTPLSSLSSIWPYEDLNELYPSAFESRTLSEDPENPGTYRLTFSGLSDSYSKEKFDQLKKTIASNGRSEIYLYTGRDHKLAAAGFGSESGQDEDSLVFDRVYFGDGTITENNVSLFRLMLAKSSTTDSIYLYHDQTQFISDDSPVVYDREAEVSADLIYRVPEEELALEHFKNEIHADGVLVNADLSDYGNSSLYYLAENRPEASEFVRSLKSFLSSEEACIPDGYYIQFSSPAREGFNQAVLGISKRYQSEEGSWDIRFLIFEEDTDGYYEDLLREMKADPIVSEWVEE